MSVERLASVTLKNVSNQYFMLRAMYRFSGQQTVSSKWHMMAPRQISPAAIHKIAYYTGCPYASEFRLHGIRYTVCGESEPLCVRFDGKHLRMDDIHLMANGKWVRHELIDSDENQKVVVCVGLPEVHIVSAAASTSKLFQMLAIPSPSVFALHIPFGYFYNQLLLFVNWQQLRVHVVFGTCTMLIFGLWYKCIYPQTKALYDLLCNHPYTEADLQYNPCLDDEYEGYGVYDDDHFVDTDGVEAYVVTAWRQEEEEEEVDRKRERKEGPEVVVWL
ncbi:unnamed protein product [Caenorhabditis sp. 36 PRJEB53466]|nr:unnamed protein product [Caenorhabditis sp. 36 PRJEB53466]